MAATPRCAAAESAPRINITKPCTAKPAPIKRRSSCATCRIFCRPTRNPSSTGPDPTISPWPGVLFPVAAPRLKWRPSRPPHRSLRSAPSATSRASRFPLILRRVGRCTSMPATRSVRAPGPTGDLSFSTSTTWAAPYWKRSSRSTTTRSISPRARAMPVPNGASISAIRAPFIATVICPTRSSNRSRSDRRSCRDSSPPPSPKVKCPWNRTTTITTCTSRSPACCR